MKSSSFRSIVLPALIASSAAFSIFTLPLTSSKTAELAVNLPPVISRWTTPVLANQHKDSSIRHVGFAILSSVLIGVGTAELMRQRRLRLAQQQNLLDQALAVEGEEEATVSWIEGASAESLMGATDMWQPPSDESQLQPWASAPISDTESFREIMELNWQEFSASSNDPAKLSNSADSSETDSSEAPEPAYPSTYRIQVPGNQRLLAIQVDGDYYSFYRRRATAEQARSVINQLQRRGKKAIMTPDQKGYGVWMHQPEAVLDIASWSAFKPAG